ncbi:diguanylate cyclase [Bradyrhizobium oligotrophicum S58]|uniref:diguanylate cyclase n=1 Tax=Bradyrhizobium oligotrophicum S58 TaxID=1245469 RepID=M4ZYP1_9BRAD|nr:diguanylate cyclase [Bradyrhizobium oligotrophicum]BAM91565.1 diguanylate cyclase [Bradyrhizobium oligotrophicum S58]
MSLNLPQISLSVSIKNSLLTSVFLLLAILGGVSVMATMRLSALQDAVESIDRDRLPKIRALGDLNADIAHTHLVAIRAALSSVAEPRAAAEQELRRRTTEVDARIAHFKETIGADAPMRMAFDQFVNKWDLYQKQQAVMLEPDVGANRDRLEHVVNIETPPIFQALVDAIGHGIRLADHRADSAIDSATLDAQVFRLVLWSVNGVSILIGLATLLFVIHDVSTPIFRITRSMEAIAEGELQTEIPYADHTNELGMMARALAVFRTSLVENERLNAATRTLSELSEWLQSAKSEPELYQMISTVLGGLMPECTGALYIYADSRDVLEVASEWNGAALTRSLHPDDCWSLRRGHVYIHGTNEVEFRCDHVHDGVDENYCCIPILAHGEIVGLLHVEYNFTGAETAAEAKARFADRARLGLACAEHLSIAIANMKLREGLRDQSLRDALTGLNNRRYLIETARRELLRASRSGAPLSVVTLDIDHFKSFNDNHGHEAGDAVLRHVGDILKAMFTGCDVPCRLGGEEFVVMLPNCTIEEAALRAEELRARVEALNISYGESMLPRVTISVGVAAYPEAGIDLPEILRVADGALYRAKHKGRNRVELASGGMVPPIDEMTNRAVAALDAIVAQVDTRPIAPTDAGKDQQIA